MEKVYNLLDKMDLQQDNDDMMSSHEARSKMLLKNEALRHLLPIYKKTSLLIWSKLNFSVNSGDTNVVVEGIFSEDMYLVVKWIINDLKTQGYTVATERSGDVVKFLINWI